MRSWYRLEDWRATADTALESLISRYFQYVSGEASFIMDEDWDTLLMLDACRHDVFEELNTIPGQLNHRFSTGSMTGEVFEKNFQNNVHYDTVYVTANPVPRDSRWCDVDLDKVFHDVVDVWKHHWDETLNTVRPGPVAEAIRAAHRDYPRKRILGHFIQPHQPFIGETGQEIDESGMQAYHKITGKETSSEQKIWERIRTGEITTERAWRAYKENLSLVLPYARELCEELPGKTVVTSDHGNLFGEFAWPFPVRKYGHPRGIRMKKLIKVPWLETGFERRREIVSELPDDAADETAADDQLDRLKYLGYR